MQSSEDSQDVSTDYGPLSQRQAENIADLAARRAEERLYAQIGRSILKKAIYFGGAAMVALLTWLSGWIHLGPPK